MQRSCRLSDLPIALLQLEFVVNVCDMSSELKRSLLSVEYPGFVKNDAKAIDSLGGEAGIQKVCPSCQLPGAIARIQCAISIRALSGAERGRALPHGPAAPCR